MNLQDVRTGIAVLMNQFETEPEHVLHVRDLALQLYDGFQSWHGLTDFDRLILEAASALHDIGWKITGQEGKGHHKASAKLIREHDWNSLTPREVELIALAARYHRKATPSLEHEEFARLTIEDQKRVSILAAFLRVGDALDRRHRQFVLNLRVVLSPETAEILVRSPREVEEELEAAEKKGDLLAECYPGLVLYTWEIVQWEPGINSP